MQVMDKHAKPCGWTLVSLRPQGQHAALRAAVAPMGGAVVALSPWRLRRNATPASARALHAALRASSVVVTSPAAVAAATGLGVCFAAEPFPTWFCVGDGTRRALLAAGARTVLAPTRMDSEGLLALPELADVAGKDVGLITAPGGRGLLAAALQARGARIRRADIYERQPLRLPARALARLSHSPQPWVLALSSGEALQRLWDQLSPAWRTRWQQQMHVVAASDRLLLQAQALGFLHVVRAEGPTSAQLVAACAALLADAVRP